MNERTKDRNRLCVIGENIYMLGDGLGGKKYTNRDLSISAAHKRAFADPQESLCRSTKEP